MNATEFWYYLRVIGACQDARDWVVSFEEAPLETVYDALELKDRPWLAWLVDELYTRYKTPRTYVMRKRLMDWYDSVGFVEMSLEIDRRREATFLVYNRTSMTSAELDEQLSQMYAEIHQKYAHIWPPLKELLRDDLIAELKERI